MSITDTTMGTKRIDHEHERLDDLRPTVVQQAHQARHVSRGTQRAATLPHALKRAPAVAPTKHPESRDPSSPTG